MQTGGLALCSAKRTLNRTEAMGWATTLENVAADIRQFLKDGTFTLDDKGRPMVQSDVGGEQRPEPQFFNRESTQETAHEEQVATTPNSSIPSDAVSPRTAGGVRIATRKKQ